MHVRMHALTYAFTRTYTQTGAVLDFTAKPFEKKRFGEFGAPDIMKAQNLDTKCIKLLFEL